MTTDIADAYYSATEAALRFSCLSEEWNERFLRSLDEHNLKLIPCGSARWDGSRYPHQIPLVAPLHSTAGGPTWVPSYMVWKDDKLLPVVWSAAVMPNDALAPDGLVGRLLNPTGANPTGANPEPEITPEEAEPAAAPWYRTDPTLSGVITHAAALAAGRCNWQAEVIEAMRDWLPRVPPRDFFAILEAHDIEDPGRVALYLMDWLRGVLTEQAAIDRNGTKVASER